MRTGFQFEKMTKFWGWMMNVNNVNILNATKLYT